MSKWIALALVTILGGAALVAAKPLVFSAIPGRDEGDIRRRFEPLAAYFSAKLGVEVRYLYTESYGKSLGAFKEGRTQLAWLGGFSGVRGRAAVPGARPIAQAVEDTRFTSCFIAHPSTGLPSLGRFPEGIAGKSMLFGPKPSTSGRLMPEFFVRRALEGAPEEIFSRVDYGKNHGDTIARVKAGEFQVGAVACPVWDGQVRAGKVNPEEVRLIWRTPSYHDYNWTIRGDLDAEWGAGFSDRLREAILDLRDEKLLAGFPRTRFVAAHEGNFDIIREAAEAAGLGKY